MTDRADPIDDRLQGYAARWRDALPPPPAVPTDLPAQHVATGVRRFSGGWWLPLGAAAAVLAVVVVLAVRPGAEALTDVDRGVSGGPTASSSATTSATPTTPPTSTALGGVVPWAPLPPTFPVIPTTGVPESPDPALAQGLPVCRAADLRATSELTGATGTSYLFVQLVEVPGRPACRLEAFPTIVSLANGAVVTIPSENRPVTDPYSPPVSSYPRAVRVAADTPATFTLSWSNWCAPAVQQSQVRVSWPGSGGTITVAGFGHSPSCQGDPQVTVRSPFVITTFAPAVYTPETVSTAYAKVAIAIAAPPPVAASGVLTVEVTLTAAADLALDPCPDLTMSIGQQSATTARFGLNCSGVPSRNSQGQPYLPAGVPVRFAMQLPTPDQPGEYKLVWALVLPDGTPAVAEGAAITVR